jgi:hypothetical protein
LPDLLRRVAVLTILSAVGIALLAPLSARSAMADAARVAAPLLDALAAPRDDLARGALADRAANSQLVSAPGAQAAEDLDAAALPTPAAAPMEATLYSVGDVPPASEPVLIASTDDVWDTLAECESGGDWDINTGNGYYGGLQFSLETWLNHGGAAFAEYPHQATREEQITVAEHLRAARGYAPWPSCGVELGLI